MIEVPQVLTDDALIDGIARYIHGCVNHKTASDRLASLYIETAGGLSLSCVLI